MKQQVLEEIRQSVRGFHLPRYHEIPSVGLYLEQVTKYVAGCLAPLSEDEITGSMISNYVKRGLVSNPVKKQYSQEQIAYLIFIMCAKKVVCTDDIKLMVSIQRETYTPERAYNYFCCEFENLLEYVFGIKENIDVVGVDNTNEKIMLRNAIITAAHKIYLDKLFRALKREE
ncbi:MAG: DUF1836 domain-containing protein [Clostridia bacterium]|nr:DUF1836 domain-containing protein [Clostridia bacterium]